LRKILRKAGRRFQNAIGFVIEVCDLQRGGQFNNWSVLELDIASFACGGIGPWSDLHHLKLIRRGSNGRIQGFGELGKAASLARSFDLLIDKRADDSEQRCNDQDTEDDLGG